MVAIAANGRTLLDPTFDPFAAIAAKQPLFAKRRLEQMLQKVKSPDESAEFCVHAEALAEARIPVGQGNAQATRTLVALVEQVERVGQRRGLRLAVAGEGEVLARRVEVLADHGAVAAGLEAADLVPEARVADAAVAAYGGIRGVRWAHAPAGTPAAVQYSPG